MVDWDCSALPPTVRVVRQIAPNGQVRVLMTNLTAAQAPATAFAALYHRRWRIEEAFKRLKSRLHIEAVSGLSQHAVLVDVAAKVLADNLASLMCAAAHTSAQATADKRCARTPAIRILQCALPRLLLAIGRRHRHHRRSTHHDRALPQTRAAGPQQSSHKPQIQASSQTRLQGVTGHKFAALPLRSPIPTFAIHGSAPMVGLLRRPQMNK